MRYFQSGELGGIPSMAEDASGAIPLTLTHLIYVYLYIMLYCSLSLPLYYSFDPSPYHSTVGLL